MRKTIIALLAVIAVFFGGAAVANSYMRPAYSGTDLLVSGCVIRFSNADGTPSIHANAAHHCAGVSSVRIDQHGQLEIIQTVRGSHDNPILAAIAQTDETLSARGIMVGATGGTDSTRFRLYDTKIGRVLNLNNSSDRMRVQGSTSNLWVMWFHVPGANR